MTQYSILAFCSYCDRTHPARLTITLKDGPELQLIGVETGNR
jgi:hypothetical protein